MGTTNEGERPPGPPPTGAAFLLAQLGAHAAKLFAERLVELDLTPPQGGLLRLLAGSPGRSQRELADDLGMPPSRFVAFADELERRGLIERRKNPVDRRLYAVHLTDEGGKVLAELRKVGAEHERRMTEGLSEEEREQLTGLLRRLADRQGLSPGVHPGFRSVRAERSGRRAGRQQTASAGDVEADPAP
ncbi:MarR family winged helix-turn-helix transcriptional regulator [Streptomyces sp. S465]|uniref:MarR family winged helix-turn-helix transcriptional regulator n=1 Tax=Streptomyces sp. S465 TaxID=2979468 RepID=UPI0022A81A8B|nr:MarR family transcriptional regulator [Streptomyces sp. S465]WAP58451.1 MarR family transcriptional regulator [Streptomyces sp. S465]